MVADSKENPVKAISEYQRGMNAIPKAVYQLTHPKGFSHLLCGDLFSDPDGKTSRHDRLLGSGWQSNLAVTGTGQSDV